MCLPPYVTDFSSVSNAAVGRIAFGIRLGVGPSSQSGSESPPLSPYKLQFLHMSRLGILVESKIHGILY